MHAKHQTTEVVCRPRPDNAAHIIFERTPLRPRRSVSLTATSNASLTSAASLALGRADACVWSKP